MKSDVVYLKLPQSAQVVNRKILLKDVAEIYAVDTELQKNIGDIILYTVSGDKNQKLIFSVMKLIRMIQKQHPNLQIESIGEQDFIVEYRMPTPPNKGLEYFKLAVLTFIVFIGAAFTIMTFNTDVSVGEVFDNFYYLRLFLLFVPYYPPIQIVIYFFLLCLLIFDISLNLFFFSCKY